MLVYLFNKTLKLDCFKNLGKLTQKYGHLIFAEKRFHHKGFTKLAEVFRKTILKTTNSLSIKTSEEDTFPLRIPS